MNGSNQLPVFDGENYHLWKEQMKYQLTYMKLWKFVSGKEERPMKDEEKLFLWTENDDAALALIGMSLNPRLLPIISCSTTSNQAWIKLANIYKLKSNEAQLLLLKELFTKKLTNSSGIVDHITDIRSLADRVNQTKTNLSSCKCAMLDDSVISAIILNSLPNSYASFVSGFVTKQAKDVSVDFLTSDLITESIRQNQSITNTSTSQNDQVYLNYEKQKKNPPQCSYCNKYYHTEKICRKKKFDEQQQKLHVFQDKKDIKFMIFAMDSFVIDSGASKHVTNNLEILLNIRDAENLSVAVGNGQNVDVEKVEDIIISTFGHTFCLSDVRYSPNFAGTFVSESCLLTNGCEIF